MASASAGAKAGRMRTSRGNAPGLRGVEEKKRRMRNVVGPTTSSVLTICSRNPATIDAMAMTVAIPMTTPRMVSPERSLFTRSWSSAINQPSRIEWRAMLLGAQRFDWVESRRPVRGVDTEYDADREPEPQGKGDGPEGHARGEGRRGRNENRERAAGQQACDSAEERKDHRLGEELAPNVAPRGPERLTDPDLPRALRDAHHHDVHDDDAADQHADPGHGRHHVEDDPREPGPERDQPLAGIDGKVVLLPWPQPVRDAHRFLSAQHAVRHARGRRHFDRNHRGLAAPV